MKRALSTCCFGVLVLAATGPGRAAERIPAEAKAVASPNETAEMIRTLAKELARRGYREASWPGFGAETSCA